MRHAIFVNLIYTLYFLFYQLHHFQIFLFFFSNRQTLLSLFTKQIYVYLLFFSCTCFVFVQQHPNQHLNQQDQHCCVFFALVHTHMTSSYIKISVLQVHVLIKLHLLNKSCSANVIYSRCFKFSLSSHLILCMKHNIHTILVYLLSLIVSYMLSQCQIEQVFQHTPLSGFHQHCSLWHEQPSGDSLFFIRHTLSVLLHCQNKLESCLSSHHLQTHTGYSGSPPTMLEREPSSMPHQSHTALAYWPITPSTFSYGS